MFTVIRVPVFFILLLIDVVLFFYVRNPDFAQINKESYFIASMSVDPIFIGGIAFGFLAFKKCHDKMAFFWILLPIILTSIFYYLFRIS